MSLESLLGAILADTDVKNAAAKDFDMQRTRGVSEVEKPESK